MSFFRSQRTIQTWVDEFEQLDYPLAGEIRVLEQDGAAGDNTGLVMVQLSHEETTITVQPREIGSPWWVVRINVDGELVTPPSDLMSLGTALMSVSALCAFLEAKSTAHLDDGKG